MPLREILLSKKEREFVLDSVTKSIRLDKREIYEYRDLSITFGLDYGYCHVALGSTRVLAQVAAEIDHPKESRPNEGRVSIHLEISTLAAGNLDPTKPGQLGVETRQFLERSLVFSHALDLEELCLRTGEKAWSIQLYLHVLCHDGNILDCASIAAMAALRHFRRPAVSFSGQNITVQTLEESNPVPLTLHHMPFCVSFGFFKAGNYLMLDASGIEEKVMDGKLMIAMNKHREVCCLQMSGIVQINKEQIKRCTNIAAEKVKFVSEFVAKALEIDAERRKVGNSHLPIYAKSFQATSHKNGLKDILNTRKDSEFSQSKTTSQEQLVADDHSKSSGEITSSEDEMADEKWATLDSNTHSSKIGHGVVNSWFDNEKTKNQSSAEVGLTATNHHESDDEEDTVVLGHNDVGMFNN